MIDLYYWNTPNGQKISIALEEFGLRYTTHFVNLGKGDQKSAAYVALNPNGRIPTIVDNDPYDGGAPLAVFESGAILQYLGDKTGKLFPIEARARAEVTGWLMWQMGAVGPMIGQAEHFAHHAPEKIPYAIERYQNETKRLVAILDSRFSHREFVTNELSIADIALYPWALALSKAGVELDNFGYVRSWLSKLGERPAFKRGMALVPPA
ncbi:MAG: glutathione S-transferase N-terminal domain-containing protein [Sandaracinaceae bacterium]|nr:glutathione S-transferase N-terminal domain-containing protein [Sandaracinaceae bacterium]